LKPLKREAGGDLETGILGVQGDFFNNLLEIRTPMEVLE
jgi:hypothetical protein